MNAISEIAVLLRNGKSVRQSAGLNGLPITRIETIADGTINPARVGFADLGESDCVDWLLQDGDILISHINSTKHLGKCAIYQGDPPALIHGMNLLALRVDPDVAASRYVYWILSSTGFRRKLPRITKNSVNQSSFNVSSFRKLEIPLPPLPEQKRIAAILDAADALRAKRREAIAQLDTLLQSTFLDMFGDPLTNPMGWEERSIDSVFWVARGGSPRPIQAYLTESNDGLNWIMIGDARPDSRYITSTKKRIKPEGLSKTRMVHQGDLLLTNSMSYGKPYILKTQGCIHDGWLVLSPKDKRMPADFFCSLLSTEALYREFSNKAAGAVVRNLNTKLVSHLVVAMPPIEYQHRFASIVKSVEHQKASQRAHLDELDNLFGSLQTRAFRGDL